MAFQKDMPFVSALNKITNAAYTISGAYGLFRFTLSRMVYQATTGGKNIIGTAYDEVLPTQDWISAAQVAKYKAMLATGQKLPPIIAYRAGGKVFIEDGHHKYAAYMELGIKPEMIIRNTGGPVGYSNWLNTSYQTPPIEP